MSAYFKSVLWENIDWIELVGRLKNVAQYWMIETMVIIKNLLKIKHA